MNRGLIQSALAWTVVMAAGTASRVSGVQLWSDPDTRRSGDLNITGKWTSLASHNPDDPILYPATDTLTELLRLRLGLKAHWAEQLDTEIAYEQRARWVSTSLATASSPLPPDTRVPYRIVQLDGSIGHTERLTYRHEMDRALAAFHRSWGDVTIGRQAIGLGRGVVFRVVDLFAPFLPLDVDREWRRGVDAVRVEHTFSDTGSIEALGVFGETWEQSALLGRVRGYVGQIDGEFLLGKRAQDTLVAGVVSTTVGDAEVHAELALFETPDLHPEDRLFGGGHHATTAVAGASYTFNLGKGLTVLGEYYYNGFGERDTSDLSVRLTDPAFQTRLARGDMLTLGQEALALQVSYPFNESLQGAFLVLGNPADGSGLAVPSLTWDIGVRSRLLAQMTLPWGDGPIGGQIRSEYGSTPMSLFVQWAMYW